MHAKPEYRITHIITGLAMGGAEMMLYKLVKAHQGRFDSRVISLSKDGPVGERIRSLGVDVRILGMSAALPNPFSMIRLSSWLREDQPHLVQTWMYHADLVGGVASWVAGDIPLVWGIHNTTLDQKRTKARTRFVVRINALLSKTVPDRIISCSEIAARLHADQGYKKEKIVIIPNGFNLDEFQPTSEAKTWLRTQLGLEPAAKLIGHVGRFDPQKDYPTLLQAAQRLLIDKPGLHFVLCGEGVDQQNQQLMGWVRQYGVEEHVHLLGRREDIQSVMAGFDIGTLTSAYGEAFPNVIGEMMACEIPCVVTDVGDSGFIVGETGKTVPAGDPESLASAWGELLSLHPGKKQQLGQAARERIRKLFTIDEVANRYAEVYHSLLKPVD